MTCECQRISIARRVAYCEGNDQMTILGTAGSVPSPRPSPGVPGEGVERPTATEHLILWRKSRCT